jgi:hypothetical protein
LSEPTHTWLPIVDAADDFRPRPSIVVPAENVAAGVTCRREQERPEAKAGDVGAYGDYYSLRDLIAASLYEQDAIRGALQIPPPPSVTIDAVGRSHLVIPAPGASGRQAYLKWLYNNQANKSFRDLVDNSVEKFISKPSG